MGEGTRSCALAVLEMGGIAVGLALLMAGLYRVEPLLAYATGVFVGVGFISLLGGE